MKLFLIAPLLLVGCGGDDDSKPDAGPIVPTFKGRVCILKDLRNLSTCESSGAGGLEVMLGESSATTAADGGFTLPKPDASIIYFRVQAASRTVVTSSKYVASTNGAPVVVPAVDSDRLAIILAANAAPAGGGAILVEAGRTGVTLSSTPPSTPLYSTGSLDTWDGTSTGPGNALLPGIMAADTDMTYTLPGGVQGAIFDVPVSSGGVTFVRAML